MPDLKSQLRRYYESVTWLRDPADVAAGKSGGVGMTEELEAFRARRWWAQPAVVATAVALLALLMFGGGMLLGLRLGGDDDVTGETTTTTTATTIAALPGIEDFPVSVDHPISWRGGLAAVSAGEVWVVNGGGQPGLIGRLEDGDWTLWRLVPSPTGQVSEITVAPDGTVWVAANSGVFSFDGMAWTRRFDDPAGSVGVDGSGTVWIGGALGENRLWLARWDGEFWVRVDPNPQAPPVRFGTPTDADTGMAVLPDGAVWLVEPMFGWGGDLVMRYDGTRAESVECWEYLDRCPGVFVQLAVVPNGDLLVGGFANNLDRQYRVARLDGDQWTIWPAHDWPSAQSFGASDMAAGPDGVLWFAFEGGLASVEGTEWTTRIEGPGISAVDVAPDGTVWYADSDGVHIFSTP
jgi:hypothetical protein